MVLLSCSVIGAKHTKINVVGEDCGAKFQNEQALFFATSDGHGDKKCARSSIGSQIACHVAINNMVVFIDKCCNQNLVDSLINNKKQQCQLISQLERCILDDWKVGIKEHFDTNPLTPAEISDIGRGGFDTHIYGATLICGVKTNDMLLTLQLGDGYCVALDEKLDYFLPLPEDTDCVANITTSLCLDNAIDSFRHSVIDLSTNNVVACLCMTDGVDDSFGLKWDFYKYYYDIIKEISTEHSNWLESDKPECDFISDYEQMLCGDLEHLSKIGSQDDVTITGYVDTMFFASDNMQKLQANMKKIDIKKEIYNLQSDLQSMQRGFDELECNYHANLDAMRTAQEKKETIGRQLKEAEQLHMLLNEDCSKRKMSIDKALTTCQNAFSKIQAKFDKVYKKYLTQKTAYDKEEERYSSQLQAVNDECNASEAKLVKTNNELTEQRHGLDIIIANCNIKDSQIGPAYRQSKQKHDDILAKLEQLRQDNQ